MKYWGILLYAPVILVGSILFLGSLAACLFYRKKRGPRIGLAISAVLLLFCFGRLWTDGIFRPDIPRRFSPEAWARTEPEHRHFMVDDLLEQTELVGMTEQDVRALLGQPDYVDTPHLLEYVIDLPFDASTLDLTLDNGKVTEVHITQEH